MEDRPLSSYDAVSVTPDHRSNGDCNRSSSASLIESKLQNHQNAADLSSTNCNAPSLPPQQQQQQFPMSSNNSKTTNGGDKISDNNTLQCNSASGDLISEGAPGCSSIDDWKQKLDMFLQDKGKQEMVSREKKDRRNFEQLAALASEMGLYSHHYPKIVVFSKVPLPNYRFDLDDKRPQREVNIHSGLQKRVDSCLSKYISWKSRTKERLSDICISRSSGIWSTVSDECHFEQSELQAPGKVVAKKILQERSLHLRDQQQTWQ